MNVRDICFIFILLVAGCANKNEVDTSSFNYNVTFIKQDTLPLDSHWWSSFNHVELTEFVELGLKDNLSLKANELRLKSSKSKRIANLKL